MPRSVKDETKKRSIVPSLIFLAAVVFICDRERCGFLGQFINRYVESVIGRDGLVVVAVLLTIIAVSKLGGLFSDSLVALSNLAKLRLHRTAVTSKQSENDGGDQTSIEEAVGALRHIGYTEPEIAMAKIVMSPRHRTELNVTKALEKLRKRTDANPN